MCGRGAITAVEVIRTADRVHKWKLMFSMLTLPPVISRAALSAAHMKSTDDVSLGSAPRIVAVLLMVKALYAPITWS
jgi:hypothetical protein